MFTTSSASSAARPIAALAGCLLLLAACGGEPSARDAAVQRAMDEGVGREFAECLVNGVADAFGEEALAEEFEATNDQMTETFEITDACLFPDRADDE